MLASRIRQAKKVRARAELRETASALRRVTARRGMQGMTGSACAQPKAQRTAAASSQLAQADRPDEAFTTDKAKRKGLSNAASGRMRVTCPPHHFGPIGPEHDPERGTGVAVGEAWQSRLHCRQWGTHLPHVAGIAGQANAGAQSVVLSGAHPQRSRFNSQAVCHGPDRARAAPAQAATRTTATRASGSCTRAAAAATSAATSARARCRRATRSSNRATRRCARAASAACPCASCAATRRRAVPTPPRTSSAACATTASTRLWRAGGCRGSRARSSAGTSSGAATTSPRPGAAATPATGPGTPRRCPKRRRRSWNTRQRPSRTQAARPRGTTTLRRPAGAGPPRRPWPRPWRAAPLPTRLCRQR